MTIAAKPAALYTEDNKKFPLSTGPQDDRCAIKNSWDRTSSEIQGSDLIAISRKKPTSRQL